MTRVRIFVLCQVLLLTSGSVGRSADWPAWRFDAGRTAASPDELPAEVQLLWTREFAPRRPVWDDPLNRDLMTYDRVLEPVIAAGRVFVGFNDCDQLVAYDAKTGAELWTCFTSGPVRLPPVVLKEHVYFASDDGHLYCARTSDGVVKWRFRGGPSALQVLGNQRLISAWPMRGGPVIRDGKVYVGASIWPFMEVYLYALDAESGRVVWVNDDTGAEYMKQAKGTPAFGSIAPQGALVATEKMLLVPGGRTVPAAFDRETGKMQYYGIATAGKGIGGAFVAADEKGWFVHTRYRGTQEHSLDSGKKGELALNEPVITATRLYSAELTEKGPVIRATDRETNATVWEVAADGRGDLILAGDTLYAAGRPVDSGDQQSALLTAIRLPAEGELPTIAWTLPIPVDVERLAAANDELFAVTLSGKLMAFGAGNDQVAAVLKHDERPLAVQPDVHETADELLNAGDAAGYGLWLGAKDESLIEAIASRSPFVELTVIDGDGPRVDRLRHKLHSAKLYGPITVRPSELSEFIAPPYIANMVFVGREATPGIVSQNAWLRRVYESVRPYGGVLYLLADSADLPVIQAQVSAAGLENAKVETTANGVVVRRVGSLPGSGEWTHRYGDVANTIKSSDSRVKLPLGVLWFGGVSHDDVLPRHGHGPPEQVVGGRLFILGYNLLTARDVYTGRILWQRKFNDLGMDDVFQDDTYTETPLDPAYNQVHIPGSNARGTNYVVMKDGIYLIEGDGVHVLDPATGTTLTDIKLPQEPGELPREWGYIGVYGDVLIGGVGFANYRVKHQLETDPAEAKLSPNRQGFGLKSLDRAASQALVGFDRKTGRQLWKVDARSSFWHNGIVAGNGTVFAMDRDPKPVEEQLRRRGRSNAASYRIVAFDALTGEQAWETSDVFGTWLGFSEEHDLLLQAGAAASDRLSSEVGQGMAVYQGRSGAPVWRKDDLQYSGPCVLHHDLIITNADQYAESAGAYFITDGSQKMVKNPLTGELVPWKITRAKGCNTILASENLLTYRSETAGFYDLLSDSGTGHFGGFRSGCTANLVVADGVLNAPEYTRTCSCAYQNQTSLALVHMPDLDLWSITNTATLDDASGPVRHLGVNLGAPGHRRDSKGLMWMEFPARTGEAPNLDLELNPEARFYSDPSLSMHVAETPWVLSSGVEGVTRMRLSLKPASRYRLAEGLPIVHSDDDAEESADGAVSLNSSSIELVDSAESTQLVGLRFARVNLARGAEIRSAALQFTCRTPSGEPAEFVIRAQLEENADRFSDRSRDISQRQLTTSEVRWSVAPWGKPGDAAAAQRTPDLSPLIREVTGQPGWKPGNAIVFVISGQGQRVATGFLGPRTTTAMLIVDADEAAPDAANDRPAQAYQVKLHFGTSPSVAGSRREFDVAVPGEGRIENVVLTGQVGETVVKTLERVRLTDSLDLEFTPKTGSAVLSGIELRLLEP